MNNKQDLKVAVFVIVSLLSVLLCLYGSTQLVAGSPSQSIVLGLGTDPGVVLMFLLFEKIFKIEAAVPSEDLHAKVQVKIDSINTEIGKAVSDILAEVRSQQLLLAGELQKRFEMHTSQGMDAIRQSIRQDLATSNIPPQEKDGIMKSLVEMVGHAINQMGEFQRLNLLKQTEGVVNRIEASVNESMSGVVEGVKELQRSVEEEPAPLALTAPTKRRKSAKSKLEIGPPPSP